MARANYSLKEIAAFCGATLAGNAAYTISELLTDSRKVIFPENTLFFALKTGSNNGHRYIGQLYQLGVRAFVVETTINTSDFSKASFLKVGNVLEALQQIAAQHRAHFNYPIVGITGSNGKTVIKEWLFQLLYKQKKVVRSPRSYNSQIGVPLSIWNMQSAHEVAVIEAGISQMGEMEKLHAIIKPSIGIFSNIGHAHDQGFANWELKAAEKAKLFKDSKKIVYCKDHELINNALQQLVQGDEERLVAWSSKGAHEAIPVLINNKSVTIEFGAKRLEYALPQGDAFYAENAIHALICAWQLGADMELLQQETMNLQAVEMRLEERKAIRGNLLINDFYNSDPESVRIALELLMQQPAERQKIAVISEYEGLTAIEKQSQYKQLVALLNNMPLSKVVVIGGDWLDYHAGLIHEKHLFQSTGEFLGHLPSMQWRDSAILLKGARKFQFERIAQQLQEQMHQTWLEVNLSAMENNLRYYRNKLHPQTRVMVMVKALSYGTGTTEIARWLQYNRVDYLSVAYVDEGIALRKGGISLPIMVINPDPEAFERLLEYKLEPEIYGPNRLRQFIAVVEKNYVDEEPYPIHIKLETGMHRLGFEADELIESTALLRQNNAVKVSSLFSHLAASDDDAHTDFTLNQLSQLEEAAARFTKALGYKPLLHIANTSGIDRFPSAQLDMVRLGIGLYGITSVKTEQNKLKTVLRWHTRISQLKQVKPGQSVGYGRSFVAQKPTMIATLPVGYADGFFRQLSNGAGQVYVGHQKAPIVGKVCMDMIMVDVTGLAVHEGDEVELLGDNCTVKEMAEQAQTIPYEIFTHISARVPRVYVSE